MFIDKIILGVISLATLIWAFYTLPRDSDDPEDGSGGTDAGGGSSPTSEPPAVSPSKTDVHTDPQDALAPTSSSHQ